MNKQKRCKTAGNPPNLIVLNEDKVLEIKAASKDCRLLGVNFSQDLTWRPHLATGEKPLLPTLRKQVGILAHMCRNIPVRSRKILADGLVLSRIKYVFFKRRFKPLSTKRQELSLGKAGAHQPKF